MPDGQIQSQNQSYYQCHGNGQDNGQPDLLLIHASELVTIAGKGNKPVTGKALADPVIINDGALAVKDGLICAVGSTSEILKQYKQGDNTFVVNAQGKTVIPGFVDPHTHAVYAGSREEELSMKLSGVPYLDILKQGGGILSTVRATRAASAQELYRQTRSRIRRMIAHGTTTVEIKSGYGLNEVDEIKQLQVASRIANEEPINVVNTFMAAHAWPEEFRDNHEGYVRLILSMLPEVAALGTVRYCDVFFEEGVFDAAQTRRILQAAKILGLIPKVHADEINDLGGAALAAEIGAVSAEHLLRAGDEGLRKMAEAGTAAVLLPGTAFSLMTGAYARARDMIAMGVPVALATDCNPGSSPTESMPMVLNLAAFAMRMTPSEALIAATLNAAHAVGMADRVGSLEPGKQADFVVLDMPNHLHLFYHYGTNPVEKVFFIFMQVCHNVSIFGEESSC